MVENISNFNNDFQENKDNNQINFNNNNFPNFFYK